MLETKTKVWRWINALAFLGTLTVNALADLLPIAGVKTQEISQRYVSLFSPADYAFAIWGVIYALLAGVVLYQFSEKGADITEKCGPWLAINCLLNAAWVILWHYDLIGWSVLCMAGLLVTLIVLNGRLVDLSPAWQEKWLVGAGFSLYYGWVTVATIANVATWLVKIGWSGFGIVPEIWTIVVMLLGVVITALVLLRGGRMAYAAAVVWGYAGIAAKHMLRSGYNMHYGSILMAAALSLLVLVLLSLRTAVRHA